LQTRRPRIDFIAAALHAAADEACAAHDPRGCPIINTAIKFSSCDPILGMLVDDRVQQVSQVLANGRQSAPHEGAIAPNVMP
jgi:hypothetical protein